MARFAHSFQQQTQGFAHIARVDHAIVQQMTGGIESIRLGVKDMGQALPW